MKAKLNNVQKKLSEKSTACAS